MLIICNGMLRAGSTWQYNLVRCLVEYPETGTAHGFFLDTQFADMNRTFERWADDRRYHVVKAHSVIPGAAELTAAGSLRICYIYRDIRDVALSARRKFNMTGRNLREALDHAVAVYYELKKLPQVVWQKYEDVMDDLPAAARTICAQLDFDPSPVIFERAMADCSLESAMRSMKNINRADKIKHAFGKTVYRNLEAVADKLPERIKRVIRRTPGSSLRKRITPPVSSFDPVTLLHPDHISKDRGAVGTWRKELSRQQAGELTARYKTWLVDAGYST